MVEANSSAVLQMIMSSGLTEVGMVRGGSKRQYQPNFKVKLNVIARRMIKITKNFNSVTSCQTSTIRWKIRYCHWRIGNILIFRDG